MNEVLLAPKHPYTEGLLASIPSKGKRGERLNVIKGTVPNPFNMPPGLQLRAALPVRLRAVPDPRPADRGGRPAGRRLLAVHRGARLAEPAPGARRGSTSPRLVR